MSKQRLKLQRLKKRFLNKNRIVLFNEHTFEEIFSIKINLVNVIGACLSLFLFLILSTVLLIVFTPLKELIPGYSSSELKRKAIELTLKTDSLEQLSSHNEAYIAALKRVLTGEVDVAKVNMDSLVKSDTPLLESSALKVSESDQKLRELVLNEDKYNVFQEAKPKVGTVLFPPVKGTLVEKYDPKQKRYWVVIAVPNNTAIKAISAGTVLLAEWTPQQGHILIIRHAEGIISVYKQAASLTKVQGDLVKTGEAIGLSGGGINSANTSSYVHFELWKDNYSIDPTMFIDFD
ncbi:murein hydrolase activator EnvC family protein [Flavobacterium sp. JP2137]|uniref:murein hydrolase activator EnvC family protein n=1 Tax=Flavobacterium sp. JP2137 TaxID=3414510 RepID=UPI003D2FC201